jgi:hypothetical protein
MNKNVLKGLWIVAVLIFLVVFSLYFVWWEHGGYASSRQIVREGFQSIVGVKALSYGEYFIRGTITIKARKANNYLEYKGWADHGFDHDVYNYRLEKGDLKVWLVLINTCGIESEYAKIYVSKSLRIEEEFAETYRFMQAGTGGVCEAKMDFMRKYA